MAGQIEVRIDYTCVFVWVCYIGFDRDHRRKTRWLVPERNKTANSPENRDAHLGIALTVYSVAHTM